MAGKDYFASGQWNFYCEFCGAKNKSSDGRKTWNGYWVCSHHKEVRNPQDFLRGVKDDQSVPWARPAQPVAFVAGAAFPILDTSGDPIRNTPNLQPIFDIG